MISLFIYSTPRGCEICLNYRPKVFQLKRALVHFLASLFFSNGAVDLFTTRVRHLPALDSSRVRMLVKPRKERCDGSSPHFGHGDRQLAISGLV